MSDYVSPTWQYSAICPEGYDFVRPWCKLHGTSEQAPTDAIPPSNVGTLVEGARAIAIQSMQYSDKVHAEIKYSTISSGLALLIAFAALAGTLLKSQRRPD